MIKSKISSQKTSDGHPEIETQANLGRIRSDRLDFLKELIQVFKLFQSMNAKLSSLKNLNWKSAGAIFITSISKNPGLSTALQYSQLQSLTLFELLLFFEKLMH